MAYEVLARKWRPDRFATMVGQEHVLRALVHALEQDRLHHAYLFTGTRGVGKTTVARILARCLNCEQGVGPEPCGVCASCVEIAEGRFVDLIEVDAASRTKVEDTRELLDNVQYAPTRGRYKVYLIDEVHMLSASSFNALLKTLEEPPPHVKFLLATTDPKKLPVTVLSRCLQFHLKNLTPERISAHLEHVLGAEGVAFEAAALQALARAADGSMRDALSLTDQAVAHGGGRLVADDVARMLGTIDQGALERILEGLADGDGEALVACCDDLATHAADFAGVLRELMSALHQVALAQALPDGAAARDERAARLAEVGARLSPEDVQLHYQIALTGLRDLPWAPDPRTGFEMTLLRMLAFRPEDPGGGTGPAPERGRPAEPSAVPGASASADAAAGAADPRPEPAGGDPAEADSAANRFEAPAEGVPVSAATVEAASAPGSAPARSMAAEAASRPAAEASRRDVPSPAARALATALEASAAPPSVVERSDTRPCPVLEPLPASAGAAAAGTTADLDAAAEHEAAVVADAAPGEAPRLLLAEDWHAVLAALPVAGVTRELASHCLPTLIDGWRLVLAVDPAAEALLADVHVTRLEAALAELLGGAWRVRIEAGEPGGETPAQRAARQRDERQRRAVAAIESDAGVRRLQELFNASLQQESIRPRP
jgi:DNA polymerase-3 subunit gamma/tau